MGDPSPAAGLNQVYDILSRCYGPQHWWPAETPFEMMTGAILTQSAAWSNVEKAVANLKSAGALSPAAFRSLDVAELAALIRPSGYYNAKAKKLKAMAEWLKTHDDDPTTLKTTAPNELRQELLGVHGIGPETADSILLYALEMPFFVVDAYTRRLFSRLGIAPCRDRYDDWHQLFTTALPPDPALYNEFHALIVNHAKTFCRVRPRCSECCLRADCRDADKLINPLKV
jgi:endonuclease-3 related protein